MELSPVALQDVSAGENGRAETPQPSDVLVSNLPPVDRGLDAWMFVVSSFVLEAFTWGFGFTFGVFQNYYTSSPSSPFLNAPPSAVSAIGTMALGVPYMITIFLLAICHRYPQWIMSLMWSSLALGSTCLFVSSFATSVWQLILFQGIIYGVAAAMLYAPVIIWVSEWFVARRGLAVGLIFGGSGMGGTLFPPIVGLLLQHTGFRWTLRIWAAVLFSCAGCALWYIKPRIPISATREARLAPMDLSYLKHPVFHVVAITILIQALAFFPVSLYMPTYTDSLGLPPFDGQLVLSTFNLFSVIGQIGFGHLCDIMPYSRVMIFSAVGSALAAYLLWGFARTLGVTFAFVVVFGSLSGGFSSIWPLAAAEVAGANSPSAGLVWGSFGVVKGIAAVIGPLVAGTLHDPAQAGVVSTYGSYGFGKVTLFVGSMMVATVAGSVVSAFTSQVTRRR